MSEPTLPILLVVAALDDLGVPYFIGGSVASASYGQIRTTMDADVVADLQLNQVDTLVETLQGSFYVSAEMIRDAIAQRSSFNLLHLQTMFKVDIFVPKARPFDQIQFERRRERAIDKEANHVVQMASPEDVVLAKLEWYRLGGGVSERQWADVVGILAVQGGQLDRAYMRQWAVELKVSDLLERAIGEAERGRDSA